MGQVAVVTGGSAGIGLATADLLARRGWSVAVLARDERRLAEAAGRLRRHGGPVLTHSVDVADAGAVEDAAERVERELGPVAAWVNNAMSTVVAPADEITPEEYARVTATTYLGQVHGTLAALRRMKPRGRGSIVQVSSGLGFRAAPLQAAYCAAKFAVSGFTDALRAELIADGVRGIGLSVVYLPAVNTPQFGWARNRTGHEQNAPDPIYDPRLCAEAIAFAAENPRREIWVGNSTAVMAVTQSLVPSIADHQVAGFKDAQLGAPAPTSGATSTIRWPGRRRSMAGSRIGCRRRARSSTPAISATPQARRPHGAGRGSPDRHLARGRAAAMMFRGWGVARAGRGTAGPRP